MKLGILGGTFDPIHLGHLLIAEVTRESLGLAKVLFTPAGDPPHKQGVEKTPAIHRRRMVELAIADNPSFELCPIDLERPGPHYAVDTARLICGRYQLAADDCFFIIGSDSLADLPAWRQPAQLIEVCRLAVVHRPGYQADLSGLAQIIPGLQQRLDWVEIPTVDFSSSTIRRRVAEGQSVRYQLPNRVREYINEHKLYFTPPPSPD